MYVVNQGYVTWYSLEYDRFVVPCRRSLRAHAPAIHATSNFDHEKSFAWYQNLRKNLVTDAGENFCKRITISFGLTSDWMKMWREFVRPIA